MRRLRHSAIRPVLSGTGARKAHPSNPDAGKFLNFEPNGSALLASGREYGSFAGRCSSLLQKRREFKRKLRALGIDRDILHIDHGTLATPETEIDRVTRSSSVEHLSQQALPPF